MNTVLEYFCQGLPRYDLTELGLKPEAPVTLELWMMIPVFWFISCWSHSCWVLCLLDRDIFIWIVATILLVSYKKILCRYSNIFVTAPSPENLKTLFDFICKGFDALNYKVLVLSLADSYNPYWLVYWEKIKSHIG